MSGFGPARPMGVSAGEDGNTSHHDAERWALDQREEGEHWTELQRYSSKEMAQQALDEAAATGEIALENLRVRHVD
jgi:hypothetical protein